jgi:hypothetical protein
MPDIAILVRGKARDFDDIYEGTKLETIEERKKLMALLSSKFSVSKWERSGERKNKWIGSSEKSTGKFELLIGNDDNVVMLTMIGVEKNTVALFSEELGLSILD